MKKYTFIPLPALVNLKHPSFNVINYRTVNEELERIEIIILAEKFEDALKKAVGELTNVVSFNFRQVPGIEQYRFELSLKKIEEINS